MSDAPTVSSFFVSGGTVPLASSSYVVREADRALLNALRAGQYCYVLTSRQMGKSSLSVRTMEALREGGARTSFVDLTRIGGRNVTPDQWYAGLLGEVGRGLGVRAAMMAYWKAHTELGPMQRFFGALHEIGLAAPEPTVVFVDEIDATRSLSFSTDEFFAGIRECYNRRTEDPVMARLTFCLIGVAIPTDLMADPTLTPFNVGERVLLRGFTAEEATPLAAGLEKNGAALVKRVVYWTGGQPFLTQSVCRKLVESGARTVADVDRIVAAEFFDGRARETNINLADVGNRVLNGYDDPSAVAEYRADILSLYAKILKGRRVLDDESNRLIAVLKLAGLLEVVDGRLQVRNRIYAHVFGPSWIAENMPIQESERQRKAYRAGMLRVAVGAGALLLGVGTLGSIAAFNAVKASSTNRRLNGALALLKSKNELLDKTISNLQESQRINDEQIYASNMHGVSDAFDHGTGRQIGQMLATQPKGDLQPGWERRYFQGLLDQGTEYPSARDQTEWHHGRIGRVSFMPNGDLLTLDGSAAVRPKGSRTTRIVYDGRGTLRRWSGTSGRFIASLSLARISDGLSLDFSPRGDFAFTTTAHGTIERYLVGDLAATAATRRRGSSLSGLALGADGVHALAWEGARRGVIDTVTGRTLGTIAPDPSSSEDDFELFPDGDVLVVHRDPDGGQAVLRRVHWMTDGSSRRLWEYPSPGASNPIDGIGCATISHDGNLIAFSDGRGVAQLLDAHGKSVGGQIEHATPITALAFDGTAGVKPTQLATGSEDGVIKVIDLKNGSPRQIFPGRYSGISSLAFSPKGDFLAAGTAYGVAERFALRGFGGPSGMLEVGDGALGTAIAKNDRWIATPGNAVRLYDAQSGKLVRTLSSGPQSRVALSQDGRTLVSCGSTDPDGKNRVHVWNAETGAPIRSFAVDLPNSIDLRLSDDGQRVLAFQSEETIDAPLDKEPALYEVASGRRAGSLSFSESLVHDARFSPDGKQVAVVFPTGLAYLYRIGQAKPVNIETQRKNDRARSIAFSPNGERLAVGWESGFVETYRATTGASERWWWGQSGPVSSVGFSKDGLTLFTASSDQSIRMWRLQNGLPVGARRFSDVVDRVETTTEDTVYAFSKHTLYALRALGAKGPGQKAPEPAPLSDSTFGPAYMQTFLGDKPLLAIVGNSTQPSTMAIRSMFGDPKVGASFNERFVTTVVLVDRLEPEDQQGAAAETLKLMVKGASACPTAFAIYQPRQGGADSSGVSLHPMPFNEAKIDRFLKSLALASPKMTREELAKIRVYLVQRGEAFARDASDAEELRSKDGRTASGPRVSGAVVHKRRKTEAHAIGRRWSSQAFSAFPAAWSVPHAPTNLFPLPFHRVSAATARLCRRHRLS